MRKKQLLKLGHGKKGRAIKGAVLSLMIIGMCAGGVSAAGNIQDTEYSEYSTKGVYTDQREKLDYTSAYIKHGGPVAINVEVHSEGKNYSANGSSYVVKVGQERYLPNYVKEKSNSRYCRLFLRQQASSAYTLWGVWSPDSV